MEFPIDAVIGSASLLVAVVTFVITDRSKRKQHQNTAEREIRQDRMQANREIYQRLELSSTDLFRWEADHLEVIRPLWEEGTPIPPADSAEYQVVANYACQILNLFEMAIRFRKDDIVPAEVFNSWVIWFYNLCNAPHFPELWAALKMDYTDDLGDVMNAGIELALKEPDEHARKVKFFEHVSTLPKCGSVKDLLARLDRSPEP